MNAETEADKRAHMRRTLTSLVRSGQWSVHSENDGKRWVFKEKEQPSARLPPTGLPA